jgi:hypothetical protein
MWQDARDVRKPLVRGNIVAGCAADGRALPAHFELEVRLVFEPARPSVRSKLSRRRRSAERVVGVQVDSCSGGAGADSSLDGSRQALTQNDRQISCDRAVDSVWVERRMLAQYGELVD